MKKIYFSFAVLFLLGIGTVAGQYKVLHNFNKTNGAYPWGSVTLSNGVLYGMTEYGGTYDSGCVFSMDTNGTNYKVLLNFDGVNGQYPFAAPTVLGNKLYGIAEQGGTTNYGRIFSINLNGSGYTDLHDFSYATGAGALYIIVFGRCLLRNGLWGRSLW